MIITSPHFLIIIFIISPQYVEFMVQTCFLSIPTTTLFSFVSCQCAPLGFRRAARLPFQFSTSTSISSSRIIVHEEIIPVDLEPADRAELSRPDETGSLSDNAPNKNVRAPPHSPSYPCFTDRPTLCLPGITRENEYELASTLEGQVYHVTNEPALLPIMNWQPANFVISFQSIDSTCWIYNLIRGLASKRT